MEPFHTLIFSATDSSKIVSSEIIQELWSGYGKIVRLHLQGGNYPSVIAKHIVFPDAVNHPRGWNTDLSHQRKVKSYAVEQQWYEKYAHQCNDLCRVPRLLTQENRGGEQFILLEDLNASGYSVRKEWLTKDQAKVCLEWLANFHALFMHTEPKGLWEIGTYWHLDTRPDEWEAMTNSPLKLNAKEVDNLLNNCKFQTLVHGDAKVANFCFSEDVSQVTAVDFQYVGGGCGMKDVAYFLGSCLSENDCERYEQELLECYFSALQKGLAEHHPAIDFREIEKEYRSLYPMTWADFNRFLLGWMPTHRKLNAYSQKMTDTALKMLEKKEGSS